MQLTKFLILILSTFYLPQIITAQIDNSRIANQDTTQKNDADTLINKGVFKTLFEGQPGKAAFYGLVLPAGGQVYNKKWWKVPIALGIDGALAYNLVDSRTKYLKAQRELERLLNDEPQSTRIGFITAERNAFRKRSEFAWIWMVAGHLITVMDAYVDRHLMNFDISPDLSFDKADSRHQWIVGLSITKTF